MLNEQNHDSRHTYMLPSVSSTCTVYTVYSTHYIQYTLYTVYVQYTLYTVYVHCTVYTIYSICTVYTMYSIHYIQYMYTVCIYIYIYLLTWELMGVPGFNCRLGGYLLAYFIAPSPLPIWLESGFLCPSSYTVRKHSELGGQFNSY